MCGIFGVVYRDRNREAVSIRLMSDVPIGAVLCQTAGRHVTVVLNGEGKQILKRRWSPSCPGK